VIALGALAACSSTDDRPRTLQYVTETILQPTCATAECHSAFKREDGYAFDNVFLAQQSLAGGPPTIPLSTSFGALIGECDGLNGTPTPGSCSTLTDISQPGTSFLLTVIYDKDTLGDRMPYDATMPDEDKQFLSDWIQDGAPGYIPPVQ
jgi:hypothetical protein